MFPRKCVFADKLKLPNPLYFVFPPSLLLILAQEGGQGRRDVHNGGERETDAGNRRVGGKREGKESDKERRRKRD